MLGFLSVNYPYNQICFTNLGGERGKQPASETGLSKWSQVANVTSILLNSTETEGTLDGV